MNRTPVRSEKYPPHDWNPAADLDLLHVALTDADGRRVLSLEQLNLGLYEKTLKLARPVHVSDLSARPGYLLETDEVSVALTFEELLRFVGRALTPAEFSLLVQRFGVFGAIRDDFYDETTGEALQPVDFG